MQLNINDGSINDTSWRQGKQSDAIVTSCPTGFPVDFNAESYEHYGGFVVAESVPPHFRNLIIAAPALLEVVRMFEDMVNRGDITIWSDKHQIMSRALRIARTGKDD